MFYNKLRRFIYNEKYLLDDLTRTISKSHYSDFEFRGTMQFDD